MVAPTIATLFQLGVDNALIQVPQNYTVPANPPSEPNPPNNLAVPTANTQITTTADSVTIYLSAIKGFNNSLSMSVLIQPMTTALAASLGYTLGSLDSTTAAWQGNIGSTSTNWLPASSMTPASNGLEGPLPFSMQPNAGNALNTYVIKNFQTLWINPGITGGPINPSHPPSYLVSIFALDPITNTYAACNFTLVVVPSVATYGLGVYAKSYVGTVYSFTNSVTLKSNGAALSPQSLAIIDYYFYPLEPASLAPAPLNIVVNWFNSPIIDTTNSAVTNPDGPHAGVPIPFSSYSLSDGLGAVNGGFSRDSPSGIPPNLGSHPLIITIYLNSTANAGSSTRVDTHALLQVTATDTNGVSISAYLAIYVAGATQ